MANVKTGPSIDSARDEVSKFTPYQLKWIHDDTRKRAMEKMVRCGITYADAFKNVRKRLLHKKRNYLFTTKDHPTALEYMRTCEEFLGYYNLTKSIISRSEEELKVPIFDLEGNDTGFAEEVKVGRIVLDNGSKILAFSSNPNAMRAYEGDAGADEYAFHKRARELWAAMQGRIRWGYDLGVWSSHNGMATEFNSLIKRARAGLDGWSYHRTDIDDAISQGLVEVINRVRGSELTREQFRAECKEDAVFPEVFEQEYLLNPQGGGAPLVSMPVLETNERDYEIARAHLESQHIVERFGEYREASKGARRTKITQWVRDLIGEYSRKPGRYRLGYDVAASRQGDLACYWVDQIAGDSIATLRVLITFRTEDWDFHKTVGIALMSEMAEIQGCGDETGLGKNICWALSQKFLGRFRGVNFSSEKMELGTQLMTALSEGRKLFPSAIEHEDIKYDFYALQKETRGDRVIFTPSRNDKNPLSHCDMAWAGALATMAARVEGEPMEGFLIS